MKLYSIKETFTGDSPYPPDPEPNGPRFGARSISQSGDAGREYFELLGASPKDTETIAVLPHEIDLIRWFRGTVARIADDFEHGSVSMLAIGTPEAVAAEFSISSELIAGQFVPGPNRINRGFVASRLSVNNQFAKYGSPCGFDRDELGDCLDGCSADKGAVGTVEKAREFFTKYPGHLLKCVSAWWKLRTLVRTVEAAEEFFADHGEASVWQFVVMEHLPHCLDLEVFDVLAIDLLSRAQKHYTGGEIAPAVVAALLEGKAVAS